MRALGGPRSHERTASIPIEIVGQPTLRAASEPRHCAVHLSRAAIVIPDATTEGVCWDTAARHNLNRTCRARRYAGFAATKPGRFQLMTSFGSSLPRGAFKFFSVP